MKINNIGTKSHLNKIVSGTRRKGAKATQQPSTEGTTAKRGDKVVLSKDVKSKAEIAHYTELVKKMADVRPEKIEQVKKKLAAGAYNKKKVYEKTAEKILEELEQ